MAVSSKHYVIYSKPSDHPEKIVVREWIIRGTTLQCGKILAVCDTLDQARSAVPPNLACISRSDDDMPFIVETWI